MPFTQPRFTTPRSDQTPVPGSALQRHLRGASTDHDPLPPQGLPFGQTLVQELPQTPTPEQSAAVQRLRERQHPKVRLITRVSGVLIDLERHSLAAMVAAWGGLVDEIAFVKHHPRENVYEADASGISEPCSDLWRRLFVWYDGTVNPCDTDYRSLLAFNATALSPLASTWRNVVYERLRELHQTGRRGTCELCAKCAVT